MHEVEGGSRAAALMWLMTYAFTHLGNSLLLILAIRFWASRLGFGPRGWDLGLEAGIWISRLGFGPLGWDLGLKAKIWAMRLGSEPEGVT